MHWKICNKGISKKRSLLMKNLITIISLLTIAALLIACNNAPIDEPITLENMRNTLEQTGEYEIFDYYIPSSIMMIGAFFLPGLYS